MTHLEELIEKSPRLTKATKRGYRNAVRSFVGFAGADPRLWTAARVEDWRDALLGGATAAPTVSTYMRGLKYASKRWARREGGADFAEYAELPRASRGRDVEPLSHAEAAKLIAACDGAQPIDVRDRAIVLLMLRTGLRRSSVCAMEFGGFSGHTLTVPVKGGKNLRIPLGRRTLEGLQPWLLYLRKRKVTSGRIFRNLTRPRLESSVQEYVGSGLTEDGLYKALRRRADLAGIEGFHPHRLRHTFVSWAREAGVPDWKLAQITGHSVRWSSSGPQARMLDNYTGHDDKPIDDLLPVLP